MYFFFPGDYSKITLKTKNVFIECTATDVTKVQEEKRDIPVYVVQSRIKEN